MKKNLLIILILMLLMSTSVCFAQELPYQNNLPNPSNADLLTDESTDYFRFVPSLQRIDSSGRFEFAIRNSKTSDLFMVTAPTIRISAKAKINGPTGANVTSDYPNHKYSVAIYEKSLLGGKLIAKTNFVADGTSQYLTVRGLSTSEEYYITVTNEDYLPAGTKVDGFGNITNFKPL